MIVFYIMMCTQSQRSNWLQRDLCAFLHYHGLSDAGLYALHNMGLGVGHATFYRQMHQAVVEHRQSIVGEINQAITNKCLMIVMIDDYTNIHTKQKTYSTQVSHMATVIIRIFHDILAVPAVSVNGPANDPEGVNIQRLLDNFNESMGIILQPFVKTAPAEILGVFFNTENERQRWTTHMYGNNNNTRQARCVQNARLIDYVEQPLKNITNYREAAGVYLNTPLNDCIKEHCLPIPGDWPSQFYQRQITYNGNIQPSGLRNTIPTMGPLHVSLNAQENVELKFMPFLRNFTFAYSTSNWQKKPKPWRISLLLELAYWGWTLIRDPVNQKMARCKDLEIRTLTNLLVNYAPLSLSIYSVLFKAGSFPEYFKATKQN